jgi:hypothetical protein
MKGLVSSGSWVLFDKIDQLETSNVTRQEKSLLKSVI